MNINKLWSGLLTLVLTISILAPLTSQASWSDGTIDGTMKYAWGEKTAWINFGTTEGNVHVTDGGLTGYAWSPNFGWINLNPTLGGVLNDNEGHLSGYAWGEGFGWIDFNGVIIDDGGYFSGYATSDVLGQISFSCLNGISSCPAGEFKVRTDWRPLSMRGESGGSVPLPKDLNKERREEQLVAQSSYVYRFWSDVFRGHFFTIDVEEANRVKNTDPNWRYEKVAYSAYINQETDTVPLYRFWSDVFKGHFYTSNYDEYLKVKNTDSNWKFEWIGYYVYPLDYAGPVETEIVYRFWSPIFLHHFYTTDYDEMVKVRDTDSNWTYEGEAFRVPKQIFTGCEITPCSAMVSCQEARHYYSDCGQTGLDDDGDGLPCENVCGG